MKVEAKAEVVKLSSSTAGYHPALAQAANPNSETTDIAALPNSRCPSRACCWAPPMTSVPTTEPMPPAESR